MSATRPGIRTAPAALAALAALAGGALVGIAGCGDSDGESGASGGRVDGEALYQEACAACHGDDLRGTARGPSHLSEVYEPGHHPDEAFRAAIEQGSPAHHWSFGDMPAVPGLNADEIDAIITYIRERQEAEGFEPYPPP